MHEEMESKMREISDTKERLMSEVHSKVAQGLKSCDVKEAGEIVDMIKDLAEAEEKCWKSCYYKTVIKAMEEVGDEYWDEGMGYTPHRSASTGRFTSRGGRGRMGYRPVPEEEDYIHGYLNDPDEFRRRMMGYNPTMPMHSNRMIGDGEMRRDEDRYGQAYRKFKDAKKYYTQTQSPEHREAMRSSANEHMADTMVTIRDMWASADPDLRKQMKANLSTLVGEMNV